MRKLEALQAHRMMPKGAVQLRNAHLHLAAAAQGDRHRDLLQARIACALADAVDGALDLPRPRLRPCSHTKNEGGKKRE